MISIRISGKGGQGVKTIGELLAEASVLEGLNAIQTAVYTPEVKGGSSSADIIISEKEIYYPLIRKIDILLAFTQNAVKYNLKKITPKSTIIYDSSHFALEKIPNVNIIEVPFENISLKEFGKDVFFNIMALGFLISYIKIISPERVLDLISKKLKGSDEINTRLFFKGLELGKKYEKKV